MRRKMSASVDSGKWVNPATFIDAEQLHSESRQGEVVISLQ